MTTFKAKFTGICPACLEAINVGDSVQYKTDALLKEHVIHERCAKRIIIVNSESFARAASKRDLPTIITVVRNAMDRITPVLPIDRENPQALELLRSLLTTQTLPEGFVPDSYDQDTVLNLAVYNVGLMLQLAERSNLAGAAEFAHSAIQYMTSAIDRIDRKLAWTIIPAAYTDLQSIITAAKRQG